MGDRCFYFRSTFNFIKNKIKKTGDKIRVGFIVQELTVFNKSKLLIEMLENDDRFEVLLLCIPSNIYNGELVDNPDFYNDTYEYLLKKGYRNLINTMKNNGEWVSVKSLDINYLFYNRPYNYYYPQEYRSKNVSKYCKICVLLYAMTMTKKEIAITLNKDFFKDVYYYFSETIECLNYNTNRYPITHALNLQKTKYTGMPVFEYFHKHKDAKKESKSWSFSKNNFRIIWTPRWTTDIDLGGSNFFEYKDLFLRFAETYDDVDLLFRPHPLLFKNFLSTGQMSSCEYEDLLNKFESMPNIDIDNYKEYISTFYNSNVLISDISSVILEYLVMGKPVIFCKNNMQVELMDELKEILESCYCVDSFEELLSCLTNLMNGIDTKRDVRERIIIKKLLLPSADLIKKELLSEFGF